MQEDYAAASVLDTGPLAILMLICGDWHCRRTRILHTVSLGHVMNVRDARPLLAL